MRLPKSPDGATEESRFFIDFEFNEDGKTIEPISVGIAALSGGCPYVAFYAECEFDRERCNPWVRENVLPHLKGPATPRNEVAQGMLSILRPHLGMVNNYCERCGQLSEDDARIACPHAPKPSIWGYYSDYDWVLFCQFFGRMVDLPKGMPMYCNDINQLRRTLGMSKEDLGPKPANEHDAAADAMWNAMAWQKCAERYAGLQWQDELVGKLSEMPEHRTP